MITVTVSSKYQVLIPKEVRNKLGINIGQKLQIVSYTARLELIPVKKISDMRGFLKGIDTTINRESDRI